MKDTDKQGKLLIGAEVEIPVHYDMWMRGARFGKITSYRKGKAGQSAYVNVKLWHPQAKRPIRVWSIDWDYMRIL